MFRDVSSRWLPQVVPPIARRFVAGTTSAEALDRARRLNDDGIGAIVNLLGEHYDDRRLADDDADSYVNLVDDVDADDLDACISVKPSQLGLPLSETIFRENLTRIVEHAAARDRFVWIDMEDHTTTDPTLDAFEELAREHEWGVGVCLQANLRRTRDDASRLADVPGKVRLVKGAYAEPSAIAYSDAERVNAAYRDLLEVSFRRFDRGIAVGSHDPAMIEHAIGLSKTHGTPFEIQMLMGVREDAQRALAREYEVWQYVPYGSRWLSYFYRRVRERRENARFALRAIVGR